jgi:hypothetical protein
VEAVDAPLDGPVAEPAPLEEAAAPDEPVPVVEPEVVPGPAAFAWVDPAAALPLPELPAAPADPDPRLEVPAPSDVTLTGELVEGTAIQTRKAATIAAAVAEDALLATDARPSHRRNWKNGLMGSSIPDPPSRRQQRSRNFPFCAVTQHTQEDPSRARDQPHPSRFPPWVILSRLTLFG